MIHISGIRFRGFKSFKRADVSFSEGFVCLAGPNGSGKCVSGDTEVLLSNGAVIQIGRLVEDELKGSNNITKMDDGVYTLENPRGLEVLSLNPETLRIEKRRIDAFVKRSGPPKLYNIRTSSGREITATGYHPLIALKGGQVRALNAGELSIGTPIALPRSIQIDAHQFSPFHALASLDLPIYIHNHEIVSRKVKKMKKAKGLTIKELADLSGVPPARITSFFDNQSTKLCYAYKLLPYFNIPEDKIYSLLCKVKGRSKPVRVPLVFDEYFARFLGYMISEGRIQKNELFFYNDSKEIKKDFAKIVKNLFDCNVTYFNDKKKTFLIFSSSAITQMLEHVFGLSPNDHSRNKLVPEQIFSSENKIVSSFLSGLYDGDGHISHPHSKKISCEYDSASKKLVAQVATLLLRFGVVARISSSLKCATNTKKKTKRTYHRVTVYGLEDMQRLSDVLTFRNKEKKKRLKTFQQNHQAVQTKRTNVDTIPAINALIKTVLKTSGYSDRKLKEIRPSKMRAYYENRCSPTRGGLNAVIDLVDNEDSYNPSLSFLKVLSNSDIFWDRIESIERVDGEKWVYDLTINGNHNFLANDIFVHNSNIIDAIRFSLGERSLKSLRAKRVSELINKYCSKGEVTLILDGEKKYEIKREIRNDGKVKYSLNGRRVTRTALLEAVRPYGLDGNHNIIAQGQVERIVEMSPKERREIIDSVAGISEFEEKKKEALSELEKVGQKINDASIVLSERKGFLTELEKEKNDAIEYKNASSMSERCRASLVHIQLERTGKHHTELMNRYIKVKEREELIKKDISVLEKRIEELEKKKAPIVERMGRGKEKESIFREVEGLKLSIATDENSIEEKKKGIERIEGRIEDLKSEKKTIDEKLSSIHKEAEGIKGEIEKCKKVLEEMGGDASTEKKWEDIDKLRGRVEEIAKSISGDERRKLLLENEIAKENELIKIKKDEADRIEGGEKAGGREEKENEAKRLKHEMELLSSKIEALFEEEKRLNGEIPPLDKRLLEIKEKLAVARATSFRLSPALLLVNELRKKDSGIYGTVADLIQFDPRYEVGIEAACGQRLSYVVVDNIDTATRAIGELKRRKAGRCTFIPINRKAQSLDSERTRLSSSGIGLLIDLVSFDKKFHSALQYVFGDTLLVESVEKAKKIGVGRIRMVTRGGEVLERSGVISGGSIRLTITTRALLSRLEKEGRGIKERNDSIYSSLYEKREEMSALRKRKMEMEVGIKNIEMELRSIAEKWEEGTKALEDIQTSIKQNNEKIMECGKGLEGLGGRIESARKEKEELTSKIKKVEDARKEEETEAGKRVRDMLTKKSSLEASLNGKESEEGMIKEHLLSVAKERESLKKERKGILNEIEDIREMIGENERKKEEREKKFKEVSSSAELLFSKLKKLEEGISAVSSQKGKLVFDKEKNSGEMKDIEMKKAMAETKLVDLKAEFERFRDVSLIETSQSELEEMVKKNEQAISSLGNVNLKAPELYDEKKKDIEDIEAKIDLLAEEKDAVLRMMDEIDEKKRAIFMETLKGVNENFKRLYSHIFKGEGFLLLEKPSDPFGSGLLIKIKDEIRECSLDALSGGEKTLLALVFIFAIQLHKPSPFYILDEADAALDKENSKKLVQLLKKLSKKTQFILATHNDTILSSADIALGVTMTAEGSKIVGVQLTKMKQRKKA